MPRATVWWPTRHMVQATFWLYRVRALGAGTSGKILTTSASPRAEFTLIKPLVCSRGVGVFFRRRLRVPFSKRPSWCVRVFACTTFVASRRPRATLRCCRGGMTASAVTPLLPQIWWHPIVFRYHIVLRDSRKHHQLHKSLCETRQDTWRIKRTRKGQRLTRKAPSKTMGATTEGTRNVDVCDDGGKGREGSQGKRVSLELRLPL